MVACFLCGASPIATSPFHCGTGIGLVFQIVYTDKLMEDMISIFTATNSAYYVHSCIDTLSGH